MGFTQGAETVFEPRMQRILTLAGLWRLVRHVVRRFVTDAPKTEPRDYRSALPGIVRVQLAPQYWVSESVGFNAETAEMRLNGVAEAIIAWYKGQTDEALGLTSIVEKLQEIVSITLDGSEKAAMVATYALWNDWMTPEDRSPGRTGLPRHLCGLSGNALAHCVRSRGCYPIVVFPNGP